ncbi:MAG: hydantoinase B/oxoprolinase family protein [Nitrospinota bacterium]|nr:hydantoinase B/oxoprolinase family protein [Nitrospinota bacterium]
MAKSKKKTPLPDMDPITFEVLRSAFRDLCTQGSAMIERIAYAPAITEGRDFSVSMLAADGRLVAHGTRDHTPHFGTFEGTVQSVIEDAEEDFRPGDVYMFNNPYRGGTHTQDVRLVRPVFHQGEHIAFTIANCHWTDVGGPVPGTFNPNAREVHAEGLLVPTMKLYDQDRPVKSSFDLIRWNVRVPHDRMGDLAAQYQAVKVMEMRIQEYAEKYGAKTVTRAFEESMNHGERLLRHEVSRLPDGTYEFTDYSDMDEGHPDHPRVKIHCVLTIRGDQASLDFRQSDPAPKGPTGLTHPGLISAAFDGTLHCFPHLTPLNNGITRSIELLSIPGSTVHILPPSPMAGYCAGTYEKVDAAVMACWAQPLAQVDPTQIHAGTVNLENCVCGGKHPRSGNQFVSYNWMEGGQGARVDRDGPSYMMMMFAGGACNQPVEVLERWYPYTYLKAEVLPDSCGHGKFRGGFGFQRHYRLWGDGVITIHGDREEVTPYGLSGGMNGGPNGLKLNEGTKRERHLGMHATSVPVGLGDVINFRSNGGGGYGDPRKRDPRLVLDDVMNELISLEVARKIYGVAIKVGDPEALEYEVDVKATRALRKRLAKKKFPVGHGPGEVHPFGRKLKVKAKKPGK